MGVLLKLNLNSCVKKESFVIIIIVIVVVVIIIIIIIIIVIIIINEQKGVVFPCCDTCIMYVQLLHFQRTYRAKNPNFLKIHIVLKSECLNAKLEPKRTY